jgi:hypothetical protein
MVYDDEPDAIEDPTLDDEDEEEEEQMYDEEESTNINTDNATIVNKLTWENHDLKKRIDKLVTENEELKEKASFQSDYIIRLEEIEKCRTAEKDFKAASSLPKDHSNTATITFPSSLFPKLVGAGGTHNDVILKLNGDKVAEVVKIK